MNYNFSGFIWSPAIEFVNEILEYINNKYPVLHFYTYEFTDINLYKISILDIYTTDDIDPEKVKNIKLKAMLLYPLKYTYFKFHIKEPNFRKKKQTGNDLSQTVEAIKKEIREKYKSKINNYIHDIIIHITDNYEQTDDIEKIMKKYNSNRTDEYINLKYFLKYNFKNNIFNRADSLVRKYTIEQYIKDKNYSFDFYNKMQTKRTNNNINYVEKFKKLIESITKNNFNNNYPIKCSNNYLLIDGSHRLSYLLIIKPIFIKIEFMKWDNHLDYDINWFIDNKFNDKEIQIIKDKLTELNIFISAP